MQDLQQQLYRNGLRGSDLEGPRESGGSGVGGLGIGEYSPNTGNSFGPGLDGSIGRGLSNSDFPGTGSAGLALGRHGSPGLEGGSGAGGVRRSVGYLPSMSNEGGHIDTEESGTSDDFSNGQVRIGGAEERGVDINSGSGANDAVYLSSRGAEHRELRE